MGYQVFLSYKNLDEAGEPTPESRAAERLYARLTAEGIRVFYSNESIRDAGTSDYTRLIDEALDEAPVLIVVTSSREHCEARWVRYEWDSFLSDLRSSFKEEGEVYTLLCEGMNYFDLPRGLRSRQFFDEADPASMDTLIAFVRAQLQLEARPVQSVTEETVKTMPTDVKRETPAGHNRKKGQRKKKQKLPVWLPVGGIALVLLCLLLVLGRAWLTPDPAADPGTQTEARTTESEGTTEKVSEKDTQQEETSGQQEKGSSDSDTSEKDTSDEKSSQKQETSEQQEKSSDSKSQESDGTGEDADTDIPEETEDAGENTSDEDGSQASAEEQ